MHSTNSLPNGFERAACEICGHDERKLAASRTDLFLGGDAVFYMHECLKCGVIYQHPRPTPTKMADFYPSDYLPYTLGIQHENWLSRFFRRYGLQKRCRVITHYISPGLLLDVGCATGDFLSEMRLQKGWQVIGIEPGHTAAVYAHNEVKLDVVEGYLNNPPFAKESFDAITMWDVLEHVYDPRTVIHQAASLLRPNGLLLVNHPNWDSNDRRWLGNFWAGYELPRHLYLFPTMLLRRLMNEVGLEEVERVCLYGSHAATGTSLTFAITKRFGNERLSQFVHKLFFSKIARLLFTPYFKAIDFLRQGSNVTAVYQKIPQNNSTQTISTSEDTWSHRLSNTVTPFHSTRLQQLQQWPPLNKARSLLTPVRRRYLWRGVSIVSLILIAIGMAYTWRELPDEKLEFAPIYLGAAIGIYVLTYTMHLLGWHALATLTFGKLTLRENVEAVAASDLVKYLPTVAWYIANRVHFYTQRKIPRGSVVAASLLEMVVMLGTGSTLYLFLLLAQTNSWVMVLSTSVIAFVTLKLVVPKIILWWRTRITAYQTITGKQERYWIAASFWYGISWPVGAVFLAVIIRAFVPLKTADYLPLLNIWLTAALIGSVVSISVGTLGIAREATLTYLLAQHWPLSVSIATAVTVKVILTLGQVGFALLILSWIRFTKRRINV